MTNDELDALYGTDELTALEQARETLRLRGWSQCGLNADWCVETYRVGGGRYLCDDETCTPDGDDAWSVVTREEVEDDNDIFTELFTGSLTQCLEFIDG